MAWNGSGVKTPQKPAPKKQPPKRRGLIAGTVVVLLGLIIIVFMRSDKEVPEEELPTAKSSRITEEKNVTPVKNKIQSVAPAKVPVKPASTNSPKWEAAKGLDPSLFPYTDNRKVLSTFTNNWDQIVDICIMPNGRSRKVIRNAKPPVFQHATDQLISIALSGSNDEELPPLPIGDNMEVEFLESLKTPIVINDDDSDAIRQAKENVIEARKIIDEELRKGRSFKDILEEHVAQRKGNAEMRETAMQAVRELQDEGDPETVNAYIEQVNGLFREKGIGEISEPVNNPKRRRKQH